MAPARTCTRRPPRTAWSGSRTRTGGRPRPSASASQPTYIVDIVNSSNNVALGELLSGGLDLDNNYLPGIAQIVNGGYNVTTYYADPPYMLSGNTAWLIPNTKKKPLDDPAFRRALAEAINPQNVVVKDYGNIVAAADPTGLLPVWSKYVDQAQVKALGATFNTGEGQVRSRGRRLQARQRWVRHQQGWLADQAEPRSPRRLV